jgi:hypothetical protein
MTTNAELEFWCYCLELVFLLQSVLARHSLGWRTSQELHFGETPDISMFRFVFWCPVWYYAPRWSFPKSKMLPGRYLGIAQNTGDAFCFLILTECEDGKPRQVIARSVVRRRYPRERPPLVEKTRSKRLFFFIRVTDAPHWRIHHKRMLFQLWT